MANNTPNFSALESELNKINYQALRALLIQQNGEIIFEYDVYGNQSKILHEAQSTTKSIQTLLLGAIQEAGFLKDLNQKIQNFFPEYQHLDWNNGKSDISIEDLITMQAGLDWNEAEVTYQNPRVNHSNLMSDSRDWLEFALSRPMRTAPGNEFIYSSAAPVMLSKIINEATQKTNLEWLQEVFFTPLGIDYYDFMRCPRDPNVLGDIDLTPHDLLKFGQLVLQRGNWNGKQLIPSAWIDWISRPIIKVDDEKSYGAMWWTAYPPLSLSPILFMWGVGGQHLFFLPEYNAVVVTMARFYEVDFDLRPFELLNNWIVPTLEESS